MLIRLTVIILQYIQILNHYVMHQKLIYCYMSIISEKKWLWATPPGPREKDLCLKGKLGQEEEDRCAGERSICCLLTSFIPEKAMAPHSSTLAWKIQWTDKPGRLKSMGSLRAGHDWATSLSLFTFMHWRRKWQPTPGFLPGESQGQRSLVGCCLWGRTESDTTEVT